MPIRIRFDQVLAEKGMKARQVAAAIGVSETHLSQFRSGKVRGVRFATLAQLCAVLGCQPGDLMVYEPDAADLDPAASEDDDAPSD